MRRKLAAWLAFAFALTLESAAAADPVTVVSEAPASAPNATRFIVHSDRLGRNYEVVVQLTRAQVFLPGQKLAAIYALDGGMSIAGPTGAFLEGRDVMAPAIIVSVDSTRDQRSSRNDDYTHHPFTLNGETAGGGGAAFEAFLMQDLKPFIEARYPADPKSSVLFGHSLGGVFAGNVFAEHPDAFAGYIIGSLVLPRDPGIVDRIAQATARAHGQRVFLAIGGAEDAASHEKVMMRQAFEALTKAFQAHPGVTLQARLYPGENHASYYPLMVLDGFRFVLPPIVPVDLPDADLSPAALARYAGVYVLPDGRTLTVKPAGFGSYLAVQVDDQPQVYWLPNGTDRFYAYTADLDVRFDKDGMTLTGRGAGARAPRKPGS